MTQNPLPIEMNPDNLQQVANQAFVLGYYDVAVNLYEQVIAIHPEKKFNYWYLGLSLLLQGQEVEAQMAWFLGLGDIETNQVVADVDELIEVLQIESVRQAQLGNQSFSVLIQQYRQDLLGEKGVSETIPKSSNRIKYSFLNEERIIESYITQLNSKHQFCVDIAASDGVTMSNTHFLYERGWSGLAVEYDSNLFAALAIEFRKFSQVQLSRCMVTPDNIISLFNAHGTPKEFGFLNLDIDGYDYFVLEQLLTTFRPQLICTEINEKIPPPIKFTVKWNPNYSWASDHFFGQSICQLNLLCEKYNYSLVELHYNNAFLIPTEISPKPLLSPEYAYLNGYLGCGDRLERFPWNAEVEEIYRLEPEAALNYIHALFAKYSGKYECSL